MSNGDVRQIGEFKFEVYRRDNPRSVEPTITLTANLRVAVSGAAARLFGKHDLVVLLYDANARVIGVQPGKPDEEGVYKPTRAGGPGLWDRNGFVLNAAGFFARYKLPHTSSRRYAAELRGDTLIMHLDQPLGIVGRSGHLEPLTGGAKR